MINEVSFMTNSKSRNKILSYLFVFTLLIYISFYGTLSIFINNFLFNVTKDVALILLAIYSIAKVRLYLGNNYLNVLIATLLTLTIFGFLGTILSGNYIGYIYGFKITILPIFLLLFGVLISMNTSFIKYEKLFLLIFIISIAIWIMQYFLGIEQLINMGFNYGVNVKTYLGDLPRLPSMMGVPESYAFTLALLGLLLANGELFSGSKSSQSLIRIFTITFLSLATIRNAIILWIISEIMVFLFSFRNKSVKNFYLYASFLPFSLIIILVLIYYYIFFTNHNFSLFAYDSLIDRLDHWGLYLPGISSINGWIGFGLGSIGAASRRTATLGYNSLDYAVDNQYIALYQQFGIIGFLVFLILTFLILTLLYKNAINNKRKNAQVAFSIFTATLIVSFFGNSLEVFPFNIMLWLIIGNGISQPIHLGMKRN
ncbi:hypothetical protein [Bacillus sp. AFS037270]|uniref:hypothetical protein n=1 Tax=Bacillus sp. AFS037270 TaxID=2033499 RepID=UPI000BFD485F|nr:hypothetical protein [Bacillus sp. AFS037270]PGV53349.1 hypothetical protein COD92_07090 [Bacillus sp. AFS037270]